MNALIANIVVIIGAFLIEARMHQVIRNRYLRAIVSVAGVSLLISLMMTFPPSSLEYFLIMWGATAAVPLLVILVWVFIHRNGDNDKING